MGPWPCLYLAAAILFLCVDVCLGLPQLFFYQVTLSGRQPRTAALFILYAIETGESEVPPL